MTAVARLFLSTSRAWMVVRGPVGNSGMTAGVDWCHARCQLTGCAMLKVDELNKEEVSRYRKTLEQRPEHKDGVEVNDRCSPGRVSPRSSACSTNIGAPKPERAVSHVLEGLPIPSAVHILHSLYNVLRSHHAKQNQCERSRSAMHL